MARGSVVTTTYLDQKLKLFKLEIDEELEKREKRLEKNIVGQIVKEIRDMREEFDVHQFSHQRINDDVIVLDKRVTALEKAS